MGTNASGKKVTWKVLAIFLAALMLITALPMAAFAAPAFDWTNVESITVGGTVKYEYVEGEKFDATGITATLTFVDGTPDKTNIALEDFWKYDLKIEPANGEVLGLDDNDKPIRVSCGNEAAKTGRYGDYEDTLEVAAMTMWAGELVQGVKNISNDDYYVILVDADGDEVPDTALTDIAKDNTLTGKTGIKVGGSRNDQVVENITTEMVWKIWNNYGTDYVIEDACLVEGTNEPADEKDDYFLNLGDPVTYKYKNIPVNVSKTLWGEDLAWWKLTDTSDAYLTNGLDKSGKPAYNLVYDAKTNKFFGEFEWREEMSDEWGSFWIYKLVPAEIESIEVKQDPYKMTYNEGEAFDPEGLVVTLKYTNGATRDVPSELLYAFDITVEPFPGKQLTVAGDNGNKVLVTRRGITKQTKSALTVLAAGLNRSYVLADFVDGKLPDGQYVVIATCDDEYVALDSADYKLGYKLNTRAASDSKEIVNKTFAKGTVIANSEIWNIKNIGTGYTFQADNGKFLARQDSTDKRVQVLGLIDDNAKEPYASTWQITGTYEEDVFSFDATSKKKGSYWLAVEPDSANYFAAINSSIYDVYYPAISFYKVVNNNYKKIEIAKQPNLNYADGDKLNLSGLTVTLIDEFDAKTTVTFGDFNAYGITTSLADGAAVAAADNGKKITVSFGNLTAETDALVVTGADLNTYTLAKELTDGKYVIVANGSYADLPKVAAPTINATRALSADLATFDKEIGYYYDGKNYNGTFDPTLAAKYVETKDGKIVSKVTKDMIWDVKAIKDKDGKVVSYEISNYGKFLERMPSQENGEYITSLETVAKKSDDARYNAWQITGAQGAKIYTTPTGKDSKYWDNYNFYLDLAKGYFDSYFVADLGANVSGGPAIPDFVVPTYATFDFYNVNAVVTDFSLVKAPKLDYVNGEKFDLSEAEFHIAMSDGTDVNVKAADIAANGITVSLADKTVLALADNGKVITATYKDKTINVGTLSVKAADYVRLAGATRIETALEIAKKGWTAADTVILASANTYADALAGAPLATAYDAPILLTRGSNLENDVLNEIKALSASKVIVLGGEKAIAPAIENTIKANGISTVRIAGADRTATSVAIAADLAAKTGKVSEEFFFVRSDDFADALSVSAIAGIEKAPIVYINKSGNVDASVDTYLKSIDRTNVKSTIIVGGTSAVGEAAESALKGYFTNVTRLGGADRYATSLLVVNSYKSLFTSKDLAVATGKNYPDALAGGAFAAKNSMPVLLVADGAGTVGVRDYIKANNIQTLYCFGGFEALSNDTVATLLN